jgi:hypothetical protein
MKQNTKRLLFANVCAVLAGVLLFGFAADVGHAAPASQPSPNGVIRGFYQRVRRKYEMGGTRVVNCDVFVVTAGDGFIVDPLLKLVRIGNHVNQLDAQGRLVLNIDLRGVPQDLRRRVTQSSPAKPVELVARLLEGEGRDAYDCESFVQLVAIDGKPLPGAPQGASSAGASGSEPAASQAPAPTALSMHSMSAIGTAMAESWYFTPHPEGQLEAVRSMNASMQTFSGGLIVYLDDVKQSFVLFNDGTWVNIGAGVEAAAAQYAGRLGAAVTGRRDYQACGGHTVDGDRVTAYVKDAAGRVLAWTILASSHTPADWLVVKGARVKGC